MKENKCCGNCKHFKNEDVGGFGFCEMIEIATRREKEYCKWHHPFNNGWIEITHPNIDEILELSKNRFVDVLDSRTMVAKMIDSWDLSLSFMANQGGYYCFVLPELEIE